MLSEALAWLTLLIPLAHWAIVISLTLRLLSRRRAPSELFGWLLVLWAIPFVGAGVYVFFGEPWLSRSRTRRSDAVKRPVERLMDRIERCAGAVVSDLQGPGEGVARIGLATDAMPVIGGNDVEILDGADEAFPALIDDIDQAQRTLEFLFYIWQPAGRVSEVERAIERAARRGVHCRVLADAAGCSDFLGSESARRLKEAGVQVDAALPVKWLRLHLQRVDLRNHRKLVIIDETIAYTGSLNMSDPKHFKVRAGVGEWVDVMARVQGPGVATLSAVFEADWTIETGRTSPDSISREPIPRRAGDVEMQVVPSGPGAHQETIHRMIVQGAHEARKELVLTTPYFIPDEAMMAALVTAAQRGVEVTLIVPERVDSRMVALASGAYYQDLLDAGARVRLYRGGLLHAKTVTIDRTIAMLGTVNMDRRSFGINFELSVFLYDRGVTGHLREVQGRYLADSVSVTETDWTRRSRWRRLMENAMQLVAPLL